MPDTKTHWDDTQFPHHHHHGGDSDLEVARQAFDANDHHHAAFHVASALADGPTNADALALFDRIIGASKEPEELFDLEGEAPSFVLVAGRAYVNAHLGRLTEAVDAIFRVQEVQPTVDYFAWALRWLEKPEAPGAVDPDGMVDGAHRWAVSLGSGDDDRPLLARGEAVLRKLGEAHPRSSLLLTVHSIALRKMGDLDGALAAATRGYEAEPGRAAAISMAMARRARGELDAAIAAFEQALEHEPDNVYVPLDIGDIELGRGNVPGALAAYQRSLLREPHQPWAEPSALFCRYKLEGDPRHLAALKNLARGAHGNDRAKSLLAELPAAPKPVATKAKAAPAKPVKAKAQAKPAKAKKAPAKKAPAKKVPAKAKKASAKPAKAKKASAKPAKAKKASAKPAKAKKAPAKAKKTSRRR